MRGVQVIAVFNCVICPARVATTTAEPGPDDTTRRQYVTLRRQRPTPATSEEPDSGTESEAGRRQ